LGEKIPHDGGWICSTEYEHGTGGASCACTSGASSATAHAAKGIRSWRERHGMGYAERVSPLSKDSPALPKGKRAD
jgi:hypothetical protein